MGSTDSHGDILRQYREMTPRSAELAARARTVLAGGVVSDTRIFEPYGIYVDRAAGTCKWDVDGNAYLDMFGGHGANMLGHAHPVMVEAVRKAVRHGVQFAANQPLEVELASHVCRLLPSAERVRFTGSGTEATLLAIRLARAFTGRRRIVRITAHYHGWHDAVASGYAGEFDGSPAPGILAEIAQQTILVRPGDLEGLARAVELYGGDIAAFMAEPLGTHFGVVPVGAEFLAAVAGAAKQAGALYILDEVLSGFRVSLHGAQGVYGLLPDLTTLAKVLCGGMPGGAVAGRADVMALLDADPSARGGHRKVMHQGTFTGNPVSMAAGIATLREMERIGACARANALGRIARSQLNEASRRQHLPFAWYGDFSIFHLFVRTDGGYGEDGLDWSALDMEAFLARPQPLLNRFRMALNILGVDVNTKSSGLLSAIHDENDVDVLVSAVMHAGEMLHQDGLISGR